MKKMSSVFSALAILIAVAAAFAFHPVTLDETEWFRLDATTGQLLNPPHGMVVEAGSDCVTNEDAFCKRLYNVDENGDPTTPVSGTIIKGDYIAP